MFNKDSLIEVKIIKENSRQKIVLMEDSYGKKYLKRIIHGDKRNIYKALQKINHPNIPKIHLVEFTEDTVVYEEFANGENLSSYMDGENKLTKKEIYDIAVKILSALETLHNAGIIHRDIKPDNIIIDEFKNVWLIDYDISRMYQKEIKRDTDITGTFGYAPIEQYGMMPTDFKSDIYSFGVTLSNILDTFGIKGHMVRVAKKCTKLDPTQRYQSAQKVKKALCFGLCKKITLLIVCLIVLAGTITWIIDSKTTTNAPKRYVDDSLKQDVLSSGEVTGNHFESTFYSDASHDEIKSDEEDIVSDADLLNNQNIQEEPTSDTTVPQIDDSDFDEDFYGFDYGETETKYMEHWNYSDICVFSMPTAWEHLVFVEDINKKGKLKMGVEDTIINADFSFYNGVLTVILSDDYGNVYKKDFTADDLANSSSQTGINADVICYDFGCDGGNELLIGLSHGTTGVIDNVFYNNIDSCLGWCIRYSKDLGFTLCNGNMVSPYYAFWINTNTGKVNVHWEDFDDITGYVLKENNIVALK